MGWWQNYCVIPYGFISRHGYQSVSALLFAHCFIFNLDGKSANGACCLCCFRFKCYDIKSLSGAEMFSGLNY